MYTENELDIRSRANVKDAGEVFTPFAIVDQMNALIPDDAWKDPGYTFLEPTCGNGQFLVKIFERRIKAGIGIIPALNTLIGMDISDKNILESRCRLHELVAAEMRVQGIKPLSRDWNNTALMAVAIIRNNIFKVKDSIAYIQKNLESRPFFSEDPTGNGQVLSSTKQAETIDKIKAEMAEVHKTKKTTMTLQPFFAKG